MGSNEAPLLFLTEGTENFHVRSVDDLNGVFLGFRKAAVTEYAMTFTHQNSQIAYPNGLY